MSVIRVLGDMELPAIQILFLRCVFALLFFVPWLYREHNFRLPKTNKIKLHILRSCFAIFAMLLWFYPVMKIDFSIAVSISFLSTMLTALFGQIFIKDKILKHSFIFLLIGFAGVLIVLQPWQAADNLPDRFYYYALFMIASTVLWALCNVIIKELGKTDKGEVITFYNPLFMIIPAGLISVFYWEPVTWYILLLGFALGALSNLMQVSLARAFALASFNDTLPYDFFRLIFATIMGIMFFSQALDIYTIIGGAVILSSAILSSERGIKLRRKAGISAGQ